MTNTTETSPSVGQSASCVHEDAVSSTSAIPPPAKRLRIDPNIQSHERNTTLQNQADYHRLANSKPPPSTKDLLSGIQPGFMTIVAPMVKASDLAFRLQCREHGADVTFTPMLYSHLFAYSPEYRKETFTTTLTDRPLVVQFAGDHKEVMLDACLKVQDYCDAIDINLGCPLREGQGVIIDNYLQCPQRSNGMSSASNNSEVVSVHPHSPPTSSATSSPSSTVLKYGSWLLETEEERNKVVEMVSYLSSHLKIPVFCKIRLLPDPNDVRSLIYVTRSHSLVLS